MKKKMAGRQGTMIEAAVEKKFVGGLQALGCLVWKFVSPGNAGVPDRLVILPDGTIFFVEMKQDDGKLSAIQKAQHERLRKHGANVITLWGSEDVAFFTRYISWYIENGEEVSKDDLQSLRIPKKGDAKNT